MATRGIYVIDGVRCYNHWDNYPSGAARHLLDTIIMQGKINLFSIIRSMPSLEQVHNNDYEGEEFMYIIETGFSTIEVYVIDGEGTPVFRYKQQIEDFINTHMAEGEAYAQKNGRTTLNKGETLELLWVIKGKKDSYDTVQQLKDQFKAEFRTGEIKLRKGHIGNALASFKIAFECIRKAGLKLDDDTRKYYTDVICPFFVKAFKHSDNEYFMKHLDGI